MEFVDSDYILTMKSLIVANWKMNPQTLKEAEHLFNTVVKGIKNIKGAEVVFCPPLVFISNIRYLSQSLRRDTLLRRVASRLDPATLSRKRIVLQISKIRLGNIKLGGQNCFWEQEGAYTGEISPSMLKSLGCEYVIIGHSERKKYFGETDETINKKLKSAFKARLKPILCIGENTRGSFNSRGRYFNEIGEILEEQIKKALLGIPASKVQDLTVAYEPVWVIGTGLPVTPDDALSASIFIRKVVSNNYNKKTAKSIRVLYGGSVDAKNVASFIREEGVNGVLVGGASVNASEFIKIIENLSRS